MLGKWVPAFAGDADLRRGPRTAIFLAAVLLFSATLAPVCAHAAAKQDCVPAGIVLWGDGRHDDTQALNAWFHGRNAIWGDSGAPVGAAIVGRRFRLSSALLVPGGTGRMLEKFRLFWPERGETVSGGEIRSGGDPNRAPVVSGVTIHGGDAGEGRPFETPDPTPSSRVNRASCATS